MESTREAASRDQGDFYMSTSTTSRLDQVIQVAVEAELNWTPELESEAIHVEVSNAVVTLYGVVGNTLRYLACGRAARRVRGVTVVTNNVKVEPLRTKSVRDTDIAEIVEQALFWANNVPRTVTSHVCDRHVTLTGGVIWSFQREAAQQVVENIRGVESIDNQISLSARAPGNASEENIMTALLSNPLIDARDVTVTVVDAKATLTGWVSTFREKKQAGLATWACSDVSDIDNRLRIRSR